MSGKLCSKPCLGPHSRDGYLVHGSKVGSIVAGCCAPTARGGKVCKTCVVTCISGVWCIKPIFQWQTCWWWQSTYLLEVGVHKTFLQCVWQISRFAGLKFLKRFQLVDNLLGPAKAKSCKIGVHKTFDLP